MFHRNCVFCCVCFAPPSIAGTLQWHNPDFYCDAHASRAPLKESFATRKNRNASAPPPRYILRYFKVNRYLLVIGGKKSVTNNLAQMPKRKKKQIQNVIEPLLLITGLITLHLFRLIENSRIQWFHRQMPCWDQEEE